MIPGIPLSPSQDSYFTALRLFMLSVLDPSVEIIQAQDNRVPPPAVTDYITLNEVGRVRLSGPVTTYADCAFYGSVNGTSLTVSSVRLGRVFIGTTVLGASISPGSVIQEQVSGDPGGAGVYTLSKSTSPLRTGWFAAGVAYVTQPSEVTIQVDTYGPASADNATILSTLLRSGNANLWFSRQGYAASGMDILDVGDPRQLAFLNGEDQYENRQSVDVKLQVNLATAPSQDFADCVVININAPADSAAS